jgi:formylglycine-generating enzyme required for sulfatase activity
VIDTDRANYDGEYTWNGSPKGTNQKTTTDVCSFPPNPWGLYDLHGNVWEWCADWYTEYTSDDRTDPNRDVEQSDNNVRVLRGGSWYGNPLYCRAANRRWDAPAGRYDLYGFRVCFRLD